jgi:purine-nucleoside phosphorylase
MNELKRILEAKNFILKQMRLKPCIAVIAGSGVAGFENAFKLVKTLEYSKIPHFAKTTVAGHGGTLDIFECRGRALLAFNGRFHFYEGHSLWEIIFPARVMKALGVETLIITAAAGAVNKKYKTGDIVVLKDHINFTGNNPLIGKHYKEFGERFPDMSAVYDAQLIKKAAKAAKIKIHEGVYLGVSGPSYETPAEISAFRKLGADVIGMSVVYEAAAASQMKMKVLGLTYVSNAAAGKNLSHKEVLEAGKSASAKIVKIVKAAAANGKS